MLLKLAAVLAVLLGGKAAYDKHNEPPVAVEEREQ